VLLSVAYMYGSPARQVDDEYAKVRMENDWTPAQAGRHPDRLIAFAQGSNLRPRESWAAFQKLPLSPAEFAHIAANVPPYFPEP
jgi:hypothetical protein